jgi:hypothetical protein
MKRFAILPLGPEEQRLLGHRIGGSGMSLKFAIAGGNHG